MKRSDMVEIERHYARMYRREASARRKKNPEQAAQLLRWADAADSRANALRLGPLFSGDQG